MLATQNEYMRWKSDGRILIPSKSDPGESYTIYVTYEGHLGCPCIGYSWYDRCRHIEKAAELLEKYSPKTDE